MRAVFPEEGGGCVSGAYGHLSAAAGYLPYGNEIFMTQPAEGCLFRMYRENRKNMMQETGRRIAAACVSAHPMGQEQRIH